METKPVFCPEYTKSSHLAHNYQADINDLCLRDYGKNYFTDTILCLDLDKYEIDHSADNDATMDAAIGIADYNQNRISNARHLLVELRFGYKSAHNLGTTNLKRKISHTKDILTPERINSQTIFLFDSSVSPQAYSIFKSLSVQDKEVKDWLATDVEGFCNYVVDRSTLPYLPENDLEEIRNSLQKKYIAGGLDALFSEIHYWTEKMLLYNLRYKHQESSAIAQAIYDFLNSIQMDDNDDDNTYLSLLLEDVKLFIKHPSA